MAEAAASKLGEASVPALCRLLAVGAWGVTLATVNKCFEILNK